MALSEILGLGVADLPLSPIEILGRPLPESGLAPLPFATKKKPLSGPYFICRRSLSVPIIKDDGDNFLTVNLLSAKYILTLHSHFKLSIMQYQVAWWEHRAFKDKYHPQITPRS